MEGRGDALCWHPSSPAPESPDAPVATSKPDAKMPPPPPPPPPTPDAKLPACSDGIDTDCDALTDWPANPGCTATDDDDEHGDLECDDGIDNDHDGHANFHIGARCGPGDSKCKSVYGKEHGGPGGGDDDGQ